MTLIPEISLSLVIYIYILYIFLFNDFKFINISLKNLSYKYMNVKIPKHIIVVGIYIKIFKN